MAVGIDVVLVERFVAGAGADPAAGRPAVHRGRAAHRVGQPAPAGVAGRPVRGQGGGGQGARRADRAALARLRDRHRPGRPAVADRRRARWRRPPPSAGCNRWHLSLSHDGGIASAMVVAERRRRPDAGDPTRGDDGMRAAWRAADIRAAEERLMATLPDGHADAAGGGRAGPAVRALLAERRRGVRRPGAAAGRRRATTAATRCSPGPCWPGAGPRCGRCCSPRTGPTPRAWPRCAPPAAGWPPGASTVAAVDLVLDGIVGIGGQGRAARRGGRGGRGAAALRGRETAAGRGRASTCPAGSTWTPARSRARRCAADVTVTFGCLKPALVVGPGGAAGRPGRRGRHRAAVAGRAAGGLGAGRGRRGPLVAAARRRLGQVHPGRGRAGHRLARRSRARRCMSVAGRAGRAGRHGPLRRVGRGRRGPGRTRRWWSSRRVADAGRVQAWLCGCGLGTDDARPGTSCGRCSARRCRWCWTPTR